MTPLARGVVLAPQTLPPDRDRHRDSDPDRRCDRHRESDPDRRCDSDPDRHSDSDGGLAVATF
ncbi:hypothetical protein Ade02nite_08990 [Paractinoplanes deccanensis]|uniref:Uncharacterized protein n=1 Tax=Paractinoplanes deccanensis TaxID=113561 RepID=A0ABQ3XWZ0_9ACTN|nr:hypothetical protein [Actinoplanes deccanensis]GID72258.1 hypothetical protein Ade02nite_08990 [Actinoplanes deccanensis]